MYATDLLYWMELAITTFFVDLFLPTLAIEAIRKARWRKAGLIE
jgi:hypothetical protein